MGGHYHFHLLHSVSGVQYSDNFSIKTSSYCMNLLHRGVSVSVQLFKFTMLQVSIIFPVFNFQLFPLFLILVLNSGTGFESTFTVYNLEEANKKKTE